MTKLKFAIGLMSGTSMDGIDAALLETDGAAQLVHGPARHLPYGADFRDELRAALKFARAHPTPSQIAAALKETTRRLTTLNAEIVLELVAEAGLTPEKIDVVGFHGQTVLHRPNTGITVQIGDGAWLAEEVGIAVVDQFRVADVAAGGEGAPLAPAYHRALCASLPGPLAVINIGGVSNVTYVDGEADPIAFDTGPGNALLDDWMMEQAREPCDRDGAIARLGAVDAPVLAALMNNTYLNRQPPKSLDRNDFSAQSVAGFSIADGAATLTAFTAEVVAAARAHFPKPVRQWIICGGGRHNATLMTELAHRIPEPVVRAEDVGWRGDDIEAEAFAYLAVRSLAELPLSWPTTTGVPRPMPGGILHQP